MSDLSLLLPQPPAPATLTPAEAQAALADLACHLLAMVATLDAIHAALPEPPDLDERLQGDAPYDLTTDILGTLECVREDNLLPAIRALQQSATTTDADLEQEYRARRQSPLFASLFPHQGNR